MQTEHIISHLRDFNTVARRHLSISIMRDTLCGSLWMLLPHAKATVVLLALLGSSVRGRNKPHLGPSKTKSLCIFTNLAWLFEAMACPVIINSPVFDGSKWSPVAFKIKVCHSGQGISIPIGTTVTPSQFSKVTSWLNRTRIPLCASQHSNSIPLGLTFQFQVFLEYKLQGTRKGTQTILFSHLHLLCEICISKFERLCWLGHTSDLLLAGPCTGEVPVTWMFSVVNGWFCHRILKQIPQKLEICSTAFSRKQKSTKQSGDENWSGYYFLSSKGQQSNIQVCEHWGSDRACFIVIAMNKWI